MPTLTVVAGPNGSGKSTITAHNDFEGSENLIDPDAIARRLDPAQPTRSAIPAGREAITRCRNLLIQGSSFVVETTLAGNGPISLIRDAKQAGYRVVVIYVALDSAELQMDRVRIRVTQGGHDIPDIEIRRRYTRSLAQAPVAIGLADEAVVFDNIRFPPGRLLEFRSGRLIWQSDSLPPWAQEIRNHFQ